MKQEIRSCYIIAPAGAKFKALQALFQKHDIQVISPAFEQGINWERATSEVISRADLIVGVLTSARRSQWVLFELGFASAMNKRLLLIAPPKTDLPPSLQGITVLRTGLDNVQAIDFAISQLKFAPPSKQIPSEQPRRQGTSVGQVHQWIDELEKIETGGSAHALEEFVAGVLRQSGVELLSEAPAPNRRKVDFAIWSDAFQSTVGNPLLVEVKRSFPEKQGARDTIKYFSKVVSDAGSYWGLLLYAKAPKRVLNPQSIPPNVLLISVDELLRQMQHKPFEAIVRDLRNARVHGGNPSATY